MGWMICLVVLKYFIGWEYELMENFKVVFIRMIVYVYWIFIDCVCCGV